MTHTLKTWPEYFRAIQEGRKKFDIRDCSDRTFSVGDELLLSEYDPETKQYTGDSCVRKVTYILWDDFPGLKKGYCILSIRE